MITLNEIQDIKLKEMIDRNTLKQNKWVGTSFENFHLLSNNKKGSIGEYFVSNYMQQKGSIVESKINSGHDRVIDGYKTEIKFSLSHHINHLSICKDWERCIALILRPEIKNSIFVWFTKKDFEYWAKNTDIFRPQAAGRSIGNTNDDYWIDSDKRLDKFINLNEVYPISSW